MNIEQAIDILKNSIADYVIGEYCEKCADNKICDDRAEDCCFQQAIDIVVTAYEKEKEEHKKECHNCDEYTARLGELEAENRMLKLELEKEKEKNKELEKVNNEVCEEINIQNIMIKESEQKEKRAYIDGTNIADKLCNMKWKDKIKAKTIEIKNRPVKDKFITASQGKLNTIIDMDSLLEKE